MQSKVDARLQAAFDAPDLDPRMDLKGRELIEFLLSKSSCPNMKSWLMSLRRLETIPDIFDALFRRGRNLEWAIWLSLTLFDKGEDDAVWWIKEALQHGITEGSISEDLDEYIERERWDLMYERMREDGVHCIDGQRLVSLTHKMTSAYAEGLENNRTAQLIEAMQEVIRYKQGQTPNEYQRFKTEFDAHIYTLVHREVLD